MHIAYSKKMILWGLLLFYLLGLRQLEAIPVITLEHAWTSDQINWGLMQRKSLPENHGMLFHYERPNKPTFWSFNCYIDLSVAFIDNNKVIKEIQSLYAYPEKMDLNRPVHRLVDLKLYPPNDPIVQFFIEKSIKSQNLIRYVLEMNIGWFERNHVKVGDKITLDLLSKTATFSTTEF